MGDFFKLLVPLGWRLLHSRPRVVEDHHADAADDFARRVTHRQAHDHEGFGAELHHVQHDRLAAGDHAAHQAVGDDLLHRQADHRGRVGDAQVARVFFVHPDDARVPVDDEHSFGEGCESAEQRLVDALADALRLGSEVHGWHGLLPLLFFGG